MKRSITAVLALVATGWCLLAQADSTVIAVRLPAGDVPALAKFYETAFGLKAIDQVGTPPTEIIMRFGATVEAAKAGSSPEFLVAQREGAAGEDSMAHAVFRVDDIAATVAAVRAAGATVRGDVASFPIGGTPVKIVMFDDPEGNVIEIMEFPKELDHLPH